jgi:tRNA (cmo5U34)-methyltransferase
MGHCVWDPGTYCERVHREVRGYESFEDEVAAATVGARAGTVSRVLDLGTGTGETARRVLALHPKARMSAVDASAVMLEAARSALPAQAEFHVQRLEDPLPADGPFELVTSALAVHHLHAEDKRVLFGRVFEALRPGGRFVLGDVVSADGEARTDADTPVADGDRPDSVRDQLAWMRAVGFVAEVVWRDGDLAVMVADRPSTP